MSKGGRLGLQRFMAGQFRHPSGVFGRLVTARLLNRGNLALNELTFSALELDSGDRVLEVGFGGGDLMARVLSVVRDGHVAGADPSRDMVAVCARRFAVPVRSGLLELREAGAEALPFGARTFTKVCSVNTVYFWSDAAGALAELRRVLADDGTLVVGFSSRSVMQDIALTRHGFKLYDAEEVVRLLDDAGFSEVHLVSGAGKPGECMCAVARRSAGTPERRLT